MRVASVVVGPCPSFTPTNPLSPGRGSRDARRPDFRGDLGAGRDSDRLHGRVAFNEGAPRCQRQPSRPDNRELARLFLCHGLLARRIPEPLLHLRLQGRNLFSPSEARRSIDVNSRV